MKGLGQEIQIDLIDMRKNKDQNAGFDWILTLYEIRLRFAFVAPIEKKE